MENNFAPPSKQPGISLYYQIEEYIRRRIQSGEWEKGMRLPSEPELSVQFGVSRATIRQAISNLVHKGMLVKRQGSGTYVARPSFREDFLPLSFPDELGGGHTLLGTRELLPGEDVRAGLGLAEGDTAVEVCRLRHFGDGQPAILEKTYMRPCLYHKIERENLSEKIQTILEDRFDIHITKVDNAVEPVLLNAEEASALEADEGDPALLLNRVYYSYQDTPQIMVKNLIRADKSRLLQMK